MKIFSLLCLIMLFINPHAAWSPITTENASPLQLATDLVGSWGISDPVENVRINGSSGPARVLRG